jgi:serine/threonine-protein phosphatase 2A activator
MQSNDQTGQQDGQMFKCLPILDLTKPHKYVKPVKRIIEGQDVLRFLTSYAYFDICTLVMQLNRSMCPRKNDTSSMKQVMTWELGSSAIIFPEPVKKMQSMLNKIKAIIEEAPPDTGPRRFGNIGFRKWYNILESRVPEILSDHLPPHVLYAKPSDEATALDELSAYLLGSFGSSQRLDYGTGHELSFLAFLGCTWKLGVFHINTEASTDGSLERSIVLGIIEPYVYFELMNLSNSNGLR